MRFVDGSRVSIGRIRDSKPQVLQDESLLHPALPGAVVLRPNKLGDVEGLRGACHVACTEERVRNDWDKGTRGRARRQTERRRRSGTILGRSAALDGPRRG